MKTGLLKTDIYINGTVAESKGLLSSVGLPQAGKELLLSYTCGSLKRLRKAPRKKRNKKAEEKINKVQAELDRRTEELKVLADG